VRAFRLVAAHSTISGKATHEIAALVATGVPLSTAARVAGVPRTTAHSWVCYGRKPGAPEHAQFAEAIQDARMEHAQAVVLRLAQLRGL